MTEYKTITYDVHGEFITQLIREKFYSGERSYEKTIDLLLGCMEGTDTPKEQLIRYAQDILLGLDLCPDCMKGFQDWFGEVK